MAANCVLRAANSVLTLANCLAVDIFAFFGGSSFSVDIFAFFFGGSSCFFGGSSGFLLRRVRSADNDTDSKASVVQPFRLARLHLIWLQRLAIDHAHTDVLPPHGALAGATLCLRARLIVDTELRINYLLYSSSIFL